MSEREVTLDEQIVAIQGYLRQATFLRDADNDPFLYRLYNRDVVELEAVLATLRRLREGK